VNDQSIGRHRIDFEGTDVVVFPDREDLNPELAPLHDYWRQTCGGAVPVPKGLVDPVRLSAKILPRFAIIEVLRDPPDFRYRLIGTALTQFFSRDNTGKRFSEISYPSPHGEELKRYFGMIARDNVVVYRETKAAWANRDYVTIASFFLPGTSDGERTDLIFGAVVPTK
jgi:hypothetical protein